MFSARPRGRNSRSGLHRRAGGRLPAHLLCIHFGRKDVVGFRSQETQAEDTSNTNGYDYGCNRCGGHDHGNAGLRHALDVHHNLDHQLRAKPNLLPLTGPRHAQG